MIPPLLQSLSLLLLLSPLVIANQTIEPNTTASSPCSQIEEAFRNVTEAGDESACRCHSTEFANDPKGVGGESVNGGSWSDGSWIGCTRHKMPSVFRSLHSLNNETPIPHLWIWDSLINILPSDMFANLRPRVVTIENSQLGVIRSGAFSSIGQGMTALRLRNNILKSIDRHTFAGLGSLTDLDLSGNKLSELKSSHFEDLESLESLTITGNQISKIEDGSFRRLRKLKKLTLEKNRLTSISKSTLAGLDSLESLSLRGNRIGFIERDAFAHMKKLRTLDLGGNHLESLSVEYLPLLSHLYLNNNSFTSLHSIQLNELAGLQVLNLDRNKLSEIDDSSFRSLHSSTQLGSISLVANNISWIGCNAFEHVSNLRVVSLQNNTISTLSCPESKEPILLQSVFHPLKKLRSLFLSRNHLNVIEDGHVNMLPMLHELALDNNNISEIGKDALKGLSRLRKLFINDNRLYYLPVGVFDGWEVDRIHSVDLSGNSWECICEREWIGEWLASLRMANTPSSSLGCLIHNGVPFNCNATYSANNEGDESERTHSIWITVVASLLAIVAVVFLIAAAYVYLQDNCYSLRAMPTLRNLPPDMMKLIPSQESLLLSYPNPIASEGLLKAPAPPISAISIRIDDGKPGREGTECGGEKKRVRFDGI